MAQALAPRHRLTVSRIQVAPYLPTPRRSHPALHHHQQKPPADPLHPAFLIAITFLTSQTLPDLVRNSPRAMHHHPARSELRSIPPPSNVTYARSVSRVPTICDRIYALTPMNVPSYAVFAVKHSRGNTIGNVMKVYTRERRSLCAVAS